MIWQYVQVAHGWGSQGGERRLLAGGLGHEFYEWLSRYEPCDNLSSKPLNKEYASLSIVSELIPAIGMRELSLFSSSLTVI